MSLIVKIMCAARGNDAHPRHGHRLLANVQEVEFIEPTTARGPQLAVTQLREPGATTDHREVFSLYGSVYVMNEAGKTISAFEVSGDGELGVPDVVYRSWSDLAREEEARATKSPPPV